MNATTFMELDAIDFSPEQEPLSAPVFTAWQLSHVINGRFLSQPITGVQRYATEVVRAMDELMAETNGSANILASRSVNSPTYKSISVSDSAVTSGYIWEQLELPLRTSRPMLSLCNVGPLAYSDQIVCLHDANVFRCPESYSNSFRLLYRFFLPLLARRAARITTVSCASRKALAAVLPLKEDDIIVLPNGHDHVLKWKADRSELAGVCSRFKPFVLMIGSAAIHKNSTLIFGLADALNERGIDIVMAGGNAPVFADAPRSRAANLHILGRVSDDDLAFLYEHALCLAFPSRCEGFGLPLLEAMALGCPVVASPIPSSLEVCGDNALFADVDDGEAWLRSVERIASSASFGADLAGRGRVQARSFTWRNAAQGYLDLAHREHL